MKKILLLGLLLPVAAIADEAEVACRLAKAQAEVVASELIAPSAVAAGGNQIAQKSILVGVSESLSGYMRAGDIRAAADAQCASYKSSLHLEQYVNWSMLDVQKKGAIASIKVLNQAIDLVNGNIVTLRKQLDAKTVTINDVNTAVRQLDFLEKTRAMLMTVVAAEVPSLDYVNVADLIHEYEADQGKSAELTAKSNTKSGWDLVVTAGENKPIGGQGYGVSTSASPFITASVRYSFGTHASEKASEEVGRDTAELLHTSQTGSVQALQRQLKEVYSLIDVEETTIANANREIDSLTLIRKPLDGIDSLLAENARKTLDVQIKSVEADLAGASRRLEEYRSLMIKLQQ